MTLRYKFVEVCPVTDEALERAVNAWVEQGYVFDGIHFVVKDSSHRPSMAFVALMRDEGEAVEAAGCPSTDSGGGTASPRG